MNKVEAVVAKKDLALKRIKETGRRYNLFELTDLLLSPYDFLSPYNQHIQEKKIIFGNGDQATSDSLFKGATYALLTAREQYPATINTLRSLEENDLIRPASMVAAPAKAAAIITQHIHNYPNQKTKYIAEMARKWQNLDLLDRIKPGTKRNFKEEFVLRNSITKDVSGLGNKTTSILLRICGTEHLIPVDSWMTEILYFHGYDLKMPRTNVNRIRYGTTDVRSVKLRKSGLPKQAYFFAETLAADLAKKYEVPGFILQLAFWTKFSSFNKIPPSEGRG